MDLVLMPSPSQYAGLDAWAWIGLKGKRPLFTSLFGDVFLESQDGVWYLDLLDGSLTREWDDQAQLRAALESAAGQDQYLLGPLAIGAHRAGVRLGPDEVYVFSPPPAVGGEIAVEAIDVIGLEVGLTVSGQLHQQLREMGPGARVTEFRIED